VQIYTVGTGVAIGQACMILSAGDKGKRFMTPHATAMLHQPRVPSTGQRQAIELHLKWKEVLEQKKAMINILSQTTGHSKDKVDKVSCFFLSQYSKLIFFNHTFAGYSASVLHDCK
jgi:ATP-dependent protease ClpP protease subunit